MGDADQRTEQPTQRRLEKARKDGQFAASREFTAALQFLVFVLLMVQFGPDWLGSLRRTARVFLQLAFSASDLTRTRLSAATEDLVLTSFLPILVGGGVLALVALAAHTAVTRFGFVPDKIVPDLKRLNPFPRLKDLPRQNLTLLAQSAVLVPLFCWAVYAVAMDNLPLFLRLSLMPPETSLQAIAASMRSLLWKAAGLFLVVGVVDLYRQKRRHMRSLRMTKQEIREEYKETEGNPQMKAHIRRFQRTMARRRMMSEVPKATAVIVNPTHFAVAIRYQMDSMSAPKVVAKGKNYLALRIRQIAVDHEIPIVENPPLAQALYKSAEVGQEIPANLYRAVAEVLAYLYRLMNGRLPAA